jgi:hypothetical protein
MMRPVEFGENLVPGTKVTLLGDERPDRIVTIIERLPNTDLTASVSHQQHAWVQFLVEDEELRRHLLLNDPRCGGLVAVAKRPRGHWAQEHLFGCSDRGLKSLGMELNSKWTTPSHDQSRRLTDTI